MKKILYMLFMSMLFLACSNKKNNNSFFRDEKLERDVRIALNYNEQQIIDIKDLDQIKKINCYYCSDLSGLRYLKNLETVTIPSSSIDDYSELSELKNIKTLSISAVNLSDVSFLKRLKSVEYLYLDNNKIADISPIGPCSP